MMDTVYIISTLLFFGSLLALAQFFGLLVRFRIKNRPRMAAAVGFVLTMVFSFIVLKIIFAPPRAAGSEMCGLGVLAEMFFIAFFGGLQAVVSVIAQFWFNNKYRS